MTIVEFLEERIAEDEEAATTQVIQTFYEDDTFCVITGGPNHFTESDHRALREVDAKRAIIRSIEELVQHAYGYDSAGTVEKVLAPLAAIYSDHPDYRKEWATN